MCICMKLMDEFCGNECADAKMCMYVTQSPPSQEQNLLLLQPTT